MNFIFKEQKLLYLLIILSCLFLFINSSTFIPLQPLIQQTHTLQTSIIRLSNQQSFSIPLNGRYISYSILQSPQNSNFCQFNPPSVEYKKLAQSNKLFQQDEQVLAILTLKRSQKVILADPYFNILVYSTDEHKLLKLLSPKTSLIPKIQQTNNKKTNNLISSISMITTEQQDYVYYLCYNNSFVFATKSLGSQILKIDVKLPIIITKTIYHKGYVVVMSQDEGIFVYKMDKKQHGLEKVQKIKKQHYHEYIDMQFDVVNQIFYMLTQSSIQVYLFKPSQFPNPDTHQFTIISLHDQIDLSNYTRNHQNQNNIKQSNQHLNLQISSHPTSSSKLQINQIFILFRHNTRQHIISQFYYNIFTKSVTFLRYYKFQMQIKQIHIVEDVILVVGNQILGMFPYGIDPRLIKEQFNGWITMSDLQKVVGIEGHERGFVGFTKNSVQYGKLVFKKEIGLNCVFNEKTNIKSITFSGNLTWCNPDLDRFYNKYCSYTKKFILQSMDIVTTSMISSSVWVVMLICTVCIILGILIMLIMHKKKQDEIRKLELYFEEKRRSQVPMDSERR